MTSIVWHKPNYPPKEEDWYLTTVSCKGSLMTIPAIYVPSNGEWFSFDSFNESVPLQSKTTFLVAWAKLPPPKS